MVNCLEQGADCLYMVQLIPLHPKTRSSLASFKSRLVLPFWYRLTQAVLEKRPLNGCSSGCSYLLVICTVCVTHSIRRITCHNVTNVKKWDSLRWRPIRLRVASCIVLLFALH